MKDTTNGTTSEITVDSSGQIKVGSSRPTINPNTARLRPKTKEDYKRKPRVLEG